MSIHVSRQDKGHALNTKEMGTFCSRLLMCIAESF
jgi:hypothetical protein